MRARIFLTHYKLLVSASIAIFYLVSNLMFLYGLDDSVNHINARRFVGSRDVSDVLQFVGSHFTNPPPPESTGLFRPMRVAHTFISFHLSEFISFFPDVLLALTAGLLCYVVLRFAESLPLSKRVGVCSTVWFFGCIPIVAMGNVVLVSQFFVIAGIYLAAFFYYRYVTSTRLLWLVCSALSIFVFSLYAEALLIAAVGIGVCGGFYLLRKEWKLAAISMLFALLAGFLVIGNAFIITWDPAQITRTFSSTLLVRGYDVSSMVKQGVFGFILHKVVTYAETYREPIFSAIFFSISPYLIIFSVIAFIYLVLVKRNYAWLAGIGIAVFLLTVNVNIAIGAVIVVMGLYYAKHYPVLVSMLFAGLIVLGPIFVIDVHLSYFLPALVLLVFKIIFDAYEAIHRNFLRYVFIGLATLLPVILVSNYASGAYLSAKVANDNRIVAEEFTTALDNGIVLSNFRHVFDLYMYTNLGRKPQDYRETAFFTATVPLYGEERAVRNDKQLEDWIAANEGKGKPFYFLVVDHNRLLGGKQAFHGPRFLDSPICSKKFEGSHVLNVSVPFFDPGFLLAPYFYRHNLAAGFIGYPIFPDMIDDIGVEYGLFSKRLFASYRLFRVQGNPTQQTIRDEWTPEGPIKKVREYRGFSIVLVNGRYLAIPQSEEVFDVKRALDSGTFASDDYCEIIAQIEGTYKEKLSVFADSANTGPYGAAWVFDGNSDSFWETTSPFPHWIQADFRTRQKTVKTYALQAGPSSHGINGRDATERMPRDWQFEASNNGSNWTVLDTQANQTDWKVNQRRTYTCANPGSFQYYRFYITAGVHPKILRLYEMILTTQTDPNFVEPKPDTLPGGVGAAVPDPGASRPAGDSTGPNEAESFTLIVLPDTQHTTLNYPQIYTSQTQWIKDNKKAMNIVFVLHEGDVTNNNTDVEWQRANTSMSILDGVVPYTFCAGNHDLPNHGRPPADPRDNAKLNEYFPVSRFEAEPWWGGCDPNNPDGRYVFFDAGGMEFMIVSLEFGPNDAMLRWANRVVSEFPNKRVIFLTHCYMYEDDTRVGPGDQWGCKGWAGDGNDGELMWDEFVKLHKNIFLVLSGHILGDGLGRLTSTGVNGNLVHQILANYQDPPIPSGSGGNGWLRIMKFVPRENKIEVRTYSPWLDKSAADEQNQFDLVYPMTTKRLSAETGFCLTRTFAGNLLDKA